MSPVEVVEQFVNAWSASNLPGVLELLHDDVYYHNIPMQPISGKAAVSSYLEAAFTFDACEWTMLNIAGQGQTVLTERMDAFRYGEAWVRLPVMGVFELRQGLIHVWRDYFDLASYRAQQQAARPQQENH